MPVKQYQIKELRDCKTFIETKNRFHLDDLITLYKDRKIAKYATAFKIAKSLAGNTGAPKAAIKLMEKYYSAPAAKDRNKKVAEANQLNTFFIKGKVHATVKYSKTTNKGTVEYPKEFKEEYPEGKEVRAKSLEAAKDIFMKQAAADFDFDRGYWKTVHVNSVEITSATPITAYKAINQGDVLMKAAKIPKYHFIPSDDRLLENDGFCVLDQLVGIYGPLIRKLTRPYVVEKCNEFYGVEPMTLGEQLDADLSDSDDEEERPNKRKKRWTIEQGVSPKCVQFICQELDISCYSFDITQKCFMKHVSVNHNYPALVYYCVNNHMYWISDKKQALSLTRRARPVESKIKSVVLPDDFEKANPFTDKEIFEDVPTEHLSTLKDVVVIYNQHNLNRELDEIIALYNYIPKVKNQKFAITAIHFNLDDRNVYLAIDPNDARAISYKDVKTYCEQNDVVFSNQSFGSFVKELRDDFFSEKSKRVSFTKEQRIKMHEDAAGLCKCCTKPFPLKRMEIDHIKPISEGGHATLPSNLQLLCKKCHFEKTRNEHESGYIKFSDTASSFNIKTAEIFNHPLCATHAFVEALLDEPPAPMRGTDYKVHYLDINKSRKNCLYYSKHDYPLFTVMDQPEPYQPSLGYKRPGIYFCESNDYFPMRGNGWYSHCMVEYCIEQGLITETAIKNVVYSSLKVPRDYFNGFIDFMYGKVDDHGKLAVNTMIGCFKPKARDNWKTLCITTDRNMAMQHYLEAKGCYIDCREIGEQTYHQVYESFSTERQETEAPIYNMILEQEAIQLHKLSKIVESTGGHVLDVSTDCVSCVFPHDKFPFTLIGKTVDVEGYYYDRLKKFPKYKVEYKDERPHCARMASHLRLTPYLHVDNRWNIIEDAVDNDFSPLIKRILDQKLSVNIDGRGGTGKTTMIRQLQEEMTKRGIKYQSLAPTNIACRLIGGETMHKFSASNTINMIRKMKLAVIIIDEVSMVPEMFYKYFLVLKRSFPTTQFIISGDFEQLLPVKDRVGVGCEYKNSNVLHELCNGTRIQLTTCRRSDSILFDLVAPANIPNLKPGDFTDRFTKQHVCFTNEKRKQINTIMMERDAKKKKQSKPLELQALDYDGNSQDVKLLAGTPIIARINNQGMGICNNETYTILKIQRTLGTILASDGTKRLEIPFGDFQRLFRPAYCITIHCSQGKTFDSEYSIHEWSKLCPRLKYVSLSRSTSKDNINVC